MRVMGFVQLPWVGADAWGGAAPVEPGPAPDLAEIRRTEQAETGAWDEVEAAVLARSAGRSRAEVRQMLIAELQSLNRPVPDDRILDLRVEQVTFVPQPLPPDASAAGRR